MCTGHLVVNPEPMQDESCPASTPPQDESFPAHALPPAPPKVAATPDLSATLRPSLGNDRPREFCIEVFAKHAQFTSKVRDSLPSSFGVGFGCSAKSAAPVVHVDLLSPGGLALCASWAREPMCKWVHIRCPTSIFPILHRAHSSSEPDTAPSILTFIQQLVKHCRDAETGWSIECRERSSFWTHAWAAALEHVVVNLCQFGHGSKSHSGCNFKHSSIQ